MGEKTRIIEIVEEVVIHKEVETIVETEQPERERVEYAIVLNSFFEREFNDPEEVLDKNKTKSDRENRVYVCLMFEFEKNTFLLPLRRNLPKTLLTNPKFQQACYPVPSAQKPNAGLDFRKIIIINDPSLYRIVEARIAHSQRKIMQDNFAEIKDQAIAYIQGFKKAAKKDRQKIDPLYKYSALNNFLYELEVGLSSK